MILFMGCVGLAAIHKARLVARELSRVAISWGELWCETLRASGRHFFNGNSKAFLEDLQPLYDLLQVRTSRTSNEHMLI